MTIQIHKYENKCKVLYSLLKELRSNKHAIKFALFCVKDCFHLCSMQDTIQGRIELIEQWLDDPTINLETQIHDVVFSNIIDSSYHAVCAISDAHIVGSYDTAYDAYHAARTAAIKSPNKKRKMREYKSYALSLLRTSDVDKSKLMVKSKIDDKSTLMALLDNLNDLNENILINKGNDGIQLNYPMKIIASNTDKLVDVIWENKAILHYLEKLYGVDDDINYKYEIEEE
jgi:RNA binding exosome subunit